MRLNDNVTPAGQTAGFLGKQWEPERFVGDPAAPDYHIEGLSSPAGHLACPLRSPAGSARPTRPPSQTSREPVEAWDRLTQHAFDLVTSGKAREAFDLRKEPEATRDRYGRYTWGQSVLLGAPADRGRRAARARQLAARSRRLRRRQPDVGYTRRNADRLQDCLCPQFDVTFPALMDDLDRRGLLDETLVVAVGEFGRTPKINARAAATTGAASSAWRWRAPASRRRRFSAPATRTARTRRRPDPAARPDRDDLPPARRRSQRRVPRQDRPAASAHQGRAAVSPAREPPGVGPRFTRRRHPLRPALRRAQVTRSRLPVEEADALFTAEPRQGLACEHHLGCEEAGRTLREAA